MKVYWANVEFDIVNPAAWEDCVGGFVYLFFQATDVLEAIPKIREALKEEDLSLRAIEFISPYEDFTWADEEDRALYDGLADEARTGAGVVWDEIAAYESRDET
ncbi:MAG TPA: hypothetical protein DHV36_04955 [Desulfobacteraceae bacterium]|mgnify:CR=1 FL=1|nr:hypothetical protein [Desulfobacteraceae bacterium]